MAKISTTDISKDKVFTKIRDFINFSIAVHFRKILLVRPTWTTIFKTQNLFHPQKFNSFFILTQWNIQLKTKKIHFSMLIAEQRSDGLVRKLCIGIFKDCLPAYFKSHNGLNLKYSLQKMKPNSLPGPLFFTQFPNDPQALFKVFKKEEKFSIIDYK